MPTRVVVTVNVSERVGGAENALWTFLRHVDRDRLDVVVAFFEPGPFVQEVEEIGFETWTLPGGRLREMHRTAATVAALASRLRAQRPGVLLNWLTKAQLYGGVAAALSGTRARTAWWQWDLHERSLVDRLATALPTAEMAACSQAVAAHQRQVWPHRRCRVILPGIDPPPVLSQQDLDRRRQELGLPASRCVVGIVGRLRPWKGQDRVVEAIAGLRRAGHDVHGLIVGGAVEYDHVPQYERLVRQRVEELELADDVTFTGHTNQATAYMQLMDVCVNASSREPFGIVVLEALALGVPVVAVDAAGPREILEGGVSGMLARTADANELAAAIEPLVGDAKLRERLAHAGRKRFDAAFTAQRMVREIEAWIDDVANPRPPT